MTHQMETICCLMDRFGMDWITATQILDAIEDIQAEKYVEGLERQCPPESPE